MRRGVEGMIGVGDEAAHLGQCVVDILKIVV